MFVQGYFALQAERMRAPAVLMPDSQMVIDWLELEYHARLDVISYTSILVRGIKTINHTDAMMAWQLYTESTPPLHWLGLRTCPKDQAMGGSEPTSSAEERNPETEITGEWLVLSPQSTSDDA